MEIGLQLATAATAVIALFLIWRQLRCQTRQATFDALTDLHKQLLSQEMQEALRFVYDTEKSYLAKPKYANHLRMIELVLNIYDLIGFRIKKRVLPKGATLETEWKILLRVWPKLKQFVRDEGARRGTPYKEHFVWLVEEARKRHPDFVPQVHKWELEDEYENPKPCVGVLLLQGNEVLLGRRAIEPFKDYWDILGGFVEVGEHPVTAAVREFKEETQLDIEEPTDLLGIFMDVYGRTGASTMNLCYVVDSATGEPHAATDVAELKTFPLSSLPERIAFKWEREALDLLKRRTSDRLPPAVGQL